MAGPYPESGGSGASALRARFAALGLLIVAMAAYRMGLGVAADLRTLVLAGAALAATTLGAAIAAPASIINAALATVFSLALVATWIARAPSALLDSAAVPRPFDVSIDLEVAAGSLALAAAPLTAWLNHAGHAFGAWLDRRRQT